MMKCVFVTGTDTDCGKTHVAVSIIKSLQEECLLTCGFKPIASGARAASKADVQSLHAVALGDMVNEDAVRLSNASQLNIPYATLNPYCLEPAIAPHVAALEAGIEVSHAEFDAAFERLRHTHALKTPVHNGVQSAQPDVVVVEGAGGWCVPLNPRETIADWAVAHNMPVIIVVGLKLGCINHALLTAQAVLASGAPLVGWVANQVSAQPMSRQAETLAYLDAHMPVERLVTLGYSPDDTTAWPAPARQRLIKAIGCNRAEASA